MSAYPIFDLDLISENFDKKVTFGKDSVFCFEKRTGMPIQTK